MALDYSITYAGSPIGGDLVAGTLDAEAGGVPALSLTLPASHPMARQGAFAIEDPTREVRLSDGDEELFRGWVTKTSLDLDLSLTVECEGQLGYLRRTVARPYACRASTDLPSGTELVNGDPFSYLVGEHNRHAGPSMSFRVGANAGAGAVRAATDWKTTWDEMNDAFCTGLDRYLNARTGPGDERYLDLLDGGVGEGSQAVVLGENVVSMEATEEGREAVTAIIARGETDDSQAEAERGAVGRREFGLGGVPDGEVPMDNSTVLVDGDRAINQKMLAAYGLREEMRRYEAKNETELLRAVSEDLNPLKVSERAVSSVTVSLVDLHALNPDVQPVQLLTWLEVFVRADGLDDGGRLVVHQWMPVTKLHVDLCDPSASEARMGDLPQTLTRQSALRLGALRRGNGTLVRRAGAAAWDNDRVWNHASDVDEAAKGREDELREELEGDISKATDAWSAHLDEQFGEATQEWYGSLGEVQREAAQGREDLLKHIDEVEGNWNDRADSLGDRLDGIEGDYDGLLGDLGDLRGTVDSHHQTLLDGIRDVAESARRTFFAVCGSSGAASAKVAPDVTTPGGEAFELAEGVVVDVLFSSANTASGPTLRVADTTAAPIVTNGDNVGVWQDRQVVRFVYDGTCWQSCSTDVYGKSVTVGNPSQANFHTDGYEAELRIGGDAYWHVGMDGQTIGFVDKSHVDIGSSDMTVSLLRPDGGRSTGTFEGHPYGFYISSDGTLGLSGKAIGDAQGGYSDTAMLTLGETGNAYLSGRYVRIRSNENLELSGDTHDALTSLDVKTEAITLNELPVVMKSFVYTLGNKSNVIWLDSSHLGVNPAGYSFNVTNGDWVASNFIVTGTSVQSGRLYVHLDRELPPGRLRLNVFGVPVSSVSASSDPGLPGPGMDDANDQEGVG